MYIVARNIESELLKELKACREHLPIMRFLHVRLSGAIHKNQDRKTSLNRFLTALEDFLDKEVFYAFICEDGDVFVLTKTMTRARLKQFLTAHLTPHLGPEPVEGLAHLFEIGAEWEKICPIVEEKFGPGFFESPEPVYEVAVDFTAEAPVPAVPGVDRELLLTLQKRRHERAAIKVLVVEDDAFTQRLIHNTLSVDYKLTICGDGGSAVAQYVIHAPDIVFLDIGLPDIMGYEVLLKIFTLDPQVYVVMLSAQGNKDNILKAMEYGAKGFVAKPFTKEKLLQYIERSPHLQNKRKVQHHGYTMS